MLKRSIAIAILFLLPCQALGQPGWYKKPGEAFPQEKFLYGLGVGSGTDPAERLQIAEENARSNLIKGIRTQISSEFISTETETAQRLDEFTQSRIVSTATLEVDGVRLERQESGKKVAYVLAVLEKKEGRQLHRVKIERLDRELQRSLAEAREQEESGAGEKALKAYLQLYPLLASREEAEAVLLALGGFGQSAFDELDQAMGEERLRRADVDAAVERLTGGDFADLDGALAALAFRLGAQLPTGKRVIVLAPTYGETKFTSRFSRYVAKTLGYKLADVGLRPVQAPDRFAPQTSDHRRDQARQAGAEIIVSGSYLEKGDELKLFLLASDVASGVKAGAVDVELGIGLVRDEGLEFLPQNFSQALQDAGVFGTDELIGGELQVEVWTDRGSENIYLEEEEEVTLAIRVNQPAHLQLVYHLANGMRALLYNNYFVDQSKVNRAVTLPDTFYVAPPLGVEVLQVLASNRPFPEVATRDWEGYPVLAEDLDQFVVRTRGLKKKQKKQEMAEMRITVTTLPRR
ncbi:MAG: DUF4384 domain-containing protein [Gemmatimonadetes bacterium]|jgi:hypothetical protein|nr:DUF4384 domain-containing protein [Gemmatimonadota bacterium]